MSLTIPTPRLLPLTIAAMALLLVSRSGELILAASGHEAAKPEAAKSEPAKPEKAKSEAKSEGKPEAAEAKVASGAAGKIPPLLTADKVPGEKPATPAEQPMTDSERSLLTDLRKRREMLDQREAAITAREATLGAVEVRLNGRFDELKQLQAKLEALEKQRQSRDEVAWQGLVKVYETMKPREAAAIFDDLDLPVLLAVLDRMKESRAAPVLAAMQPDRARQVTTELSRLRTVRNSLNQDSGAAKRPSSGG